MEKENLYGKHIYQNKPKKSKTIIRIILILIPVFILVPVGILGIINPEAMDISPDSNLPHLLIGLSAFLVVLIIVTRKNFSPYEINIFENGIILSRNSKTIEFHFKDLDGVSYYVTKHQLNGLVNVASTQDLTIFPSQGKPIILMGQNTQKLKETAEGLNAIYTNYVINNLNKENIKNQTIKFGKYLVLNNGNFIYKKGKKEIPEIPLESVSEIEGNDGVITLKGKSDKISILISESMNLDILYHIVYEVSKNL